ncbi:hypothetical protein [Xylella fastidiosa]|uniref:hypothetical protein n=1 Tax=Xylella fastidiosa TaxID=2371 RepID=UPI00042A25B9|nr:hypothetical protein [Xylella fastidiosa]
MKDRNEQVIFASRTHITLFPSSDAARDSDRAATESSKPDAGDPVRLAVVVAVLAHQLPVSGDWTAQQRTVRAYIDACKLAFYTANVCSG